MVRRIIKKIPQARERTIVHAFARGVLFEQSRPQRRRKPSAVGVAQRMAVRRVPVSCLFMTLRT
jgi:hypothetical protein